VWGLPSAPRLSTPAAKLRFSAASGASIRRASTTTSPTADIQALAKAFALARRRDPRDARLEAPGPRRRRVPGGPEVGSRREAARAPHYLVCNADESEPGTFKDRVLMEEDPFASSRR
jgi:hypothetical protein